MEQEQECGITITAAATTCFPARPVPGTAAGWSATHRPARKGTAGCQNTPYTTYDPWQDDVPGLQQALR